MNKVVDTITKVIPVTNTTDIVNIRELTAGVSHEFQVTATLEIDGELYEEEKSVAVTLVFGKYIDIGYLLRETVTISPCTFSPSINLFHR